jgi:hypothetical protein
MAAGAVWFDLVPEGRCNVLGVYLAKVVGPAQALFTGGEGHVEHGMTPVFMAIFSSCILAPVGILIAFLFYRRGPKDATVRPLHGFADLWTNGIDRIYAVLVVMPTKLGAWVLARVVDQLVIGGMVRGVGGVCGFLGEGYAAIQRGRLRISLLLSLTGAVILIAYLLAPVLGKGV